MRLSLVLNVHKHYRRVRGLMHTGKRKMVPPVTSARKVIAAKWMVNDAQNAAILERPYLTKEEEHGSMSALKSKHEKFLEMIERQTAERWLNSKPDRTIEDHLSHLNVNKKWE